MSAIDTLILFPVFTVCSKANANIFVSFTLFSSLTKHFCIKLVPKYEIIGELGYLEIGEFLHHSLNLYLGFCRNNWWNILLLFRLWVYGRLFLIY